jgi:16S rRNA (guanine966-N2)-methyltransferase
VREALFGILDASGRVRGSRVLDAFAGTGALGLEAISRGASAVTFIESAKPALAVLRKNVADLGVSARILGKPAGAVALAMDEMFDLVLCDPPWAEIPRLMPVLEALAALVAPGGTLVLEHAAVKGAARSVIPASLARLAVADTRVYGDTALTFFEG